MATPQEPQVPTTEPTAEDVQETQAGIETPEQLAELTDEQIEAVIAEATDAAQAAVDADTFDEPVFDAAFARAEAAKGELAARQEKAARLSAARDKAAQLAASRPTPRPAAPVVPSVATIQKAPAPVIPETKTGPTFSLIVPADAHNTVAGRAQGAEFASLSEVARVLDKRQESVTGMKNGRTPDRGLLEIRRHDPEFTVTGAESDLEVIDKVRDQRRLAGGDVLTAWERNARARSGGDDRRISLTAAAGWCAPSETYYDLCEMESLDGLLELPETTATRGGIRWTQEPTYPQLDAATSFTSLTEAQVIANVAKNCAPITCPSFTDTRLNVAVTCLTGSFLQLRGYPELVARWVRGELVVHAHKLNEEIIKALVATAGAATSIATPAGDPATSAILSAVELAAVDLRYRFRLADSAIIEIVLPEWALAQIRADYARRNAGDPGLTDAQIMDWFVARRVRPQFVKDWQDAYSGLATGPGGAAALTALPATVNFLAYPAGAVVLARQDVITLRNVYDSTNLAQNLYTELFFEEGWAPIYPCPTIRQYTALACPSGATAVQIDLDCTV